MKKYEQTLYYDNLYKQINEILGCSKKFIKANKSRRSVIQNKLSELCILANHTSIFNINNVKHSNLTNEYDDFNQLFQKAMMISSNRANSSDMNKQFQMVIYYISEYLNDLDYLAEQVNANNIINKVSSEQIFNICILSSTSLIKYEHSLKGIQSDPNEFLSVKFIENLCKNILIYISCIIIENNIQTSSIIKHVMDHYILISNKNHVFHNLTHQISDIFEVCVLEGSRIVNCKTTGKSFKLLSIPSKILNSSIIPTHMPRIVEPDSTHDNNIDYSIYSKNISNGFSTIDMSNETRDALIISQKKKFRINPEAVKLFKMIDELPYDIVKDIDSLPYTPLKHLIYLEDRLHEMKYNIDDNISIKIKEEFYKISKDNIKIDNIVNYLSKKIDLDDNIIKIHMEYYNIKEEYNDRLRLRKLHNTTIKFAELFTDFPIYYISTYDYRLRMYPYSYFFSRTTGIYKYLVSEFDYTKVSPDGYITMVKAYLNKFKCKYNDLGEISIDNISYIKDNFIPLELNNMINESSYFYHYLLGQEIYKLKNNDKSNFMIEIDQRSSSTVFMSIILGDKKLASKSNLISISKSDPPSMLMEEFEDYYNNKISIESIKKFINTREVHKYLLMCFCYNQSYYGRSKRIREYIYNYDDIKYISKTYPDFIDKVFNKLSIKKDLLNDIIKYYVSNSTDSIKIDTLDGSKLSWYILKTEKVLVSKRKYKSSVSGMYKSYSKKRYSNSIDIKKTVTGLIPSLIHSIDAAIMRKIINDIYNNNEYIINHLHDSIQFHPNNYKKVIESIKKVYVSSGLGKSIDNCLLNNIYYNMIPEKRKELDILINKFKSSEYEELVITEELFNVESMFPFE